MEDPVRQPARRARALPTKDVDQAAVELQKLFETFLLEFQADDTDAMAAPVYMAQIDTMLEHDRNTVFVRFSDMEAFSQELTDALTFQFYRFEPALRQGLEQVVRSRLNHEEADPSKGFYVSIVGLTLVNKIRDIRAESIGKLMAISGTVTRTSEVRPELVLGTFLCLNCNQLVRDIVQQFKYTEPTVCSNPLCTNTSKWSLQVEESSFIDWQKIRVQETSDEIPAGSMPRTLQVIVRNELVESVKPGDKCVFIGSTIVVPDVAQLTGGGPKRMNRMEGRTGSQYEGVTGLQELGVRDLTYKTAFLVCGYEARHSTVGDVNIRDEEGSESTFSEDDVRHIVAMSQEPRLYSRMASCIAPSIYGHEEIKRGILLMLFGGVHKRTSDAGMSLRGDINVCVVGDPSTAKSQFLRFVVSFLPRAVYTSGKASSAAGLTASVAKDPETGEFGIEAGALLLADNGICCIDEFDKMEPRDQVAIHEAMEQQTISIAKAGIQATLNARASILAAANPIYGRYDTTKTLKQNVSITAPIMSRFDLFYVVLDECDTVLDNTIARKIVQIHQHIEAASTPEFSLHDVQKYIAYARRIKPKLTKETMQLMAQHYASLRTRDASGAAQSAYRITVRQLESMIRLSEALARLHLDPVVQPRYVEEAARLLRQSIVRVRSENIDLDDLDAALDDVERSIEEPAAPEPKMSLSFEQYKRIANMLVLRVQGTQDVGRAELINWYLRRLEEETGIETQDELVYHSKLIRRVIQRLVDQDGVLIEAEDRLVVHPNYDRENQ